MEEDEFEKNVEKYLNWEGDSSSKEKFYYEKVFPKVLKRFLNTKQAEEIKNKKNYKYVVSLVGFSPQPVIFWHKLINPEKHFFICSPETEKTIDTIFEKIDYLPPSKYHKMIVKSTDSLDIYKTIKDALNRVEREEWENVLIDITGGKKSMAGAASIVGGLLKIDIGYIDYEKYDKDTRKPIPGTEFPITLANPLEVFGDVEIDKAKDFFNSYQFERASEILENLRRQVRDIITVEKYITLNNIYNEWNKFNIEKSMNYAREFLVNVDNKRYFIESSEADLPNKVRSHYGLLNELKKAIKGDTKSRFYIPVNFYFAATRYSEIKKFDIAVFLMYRTIESMEQIRLERYNINTANADLTQYSSNNITLSGYNNVARTIYGKNFRPPGSLPRKIALMDGYILLKVLDDEIADVLSLERILNITNLRNKSIYAHGFTPLTQNDFREIRRVAAALLEKFLEIEHTGCTLKSCEEKFKFPKI